MPVETDNRHSEVSIVYSSSLLSQEEYLKLISVAAKANIPRVPKLANPDYSNFFVEGEAGVTGESESIPLFNFEHGEGNAIHGEESAVIQLRAKYGPDLKDKTTVLCFAGIGGEPTSCGGCRDLMRENLNPESLIATVDKNGGIRAWRLKDLFVRIDEANRVELSSLSPNMAGNIEKFDPADFAPTGYWPYHNRAVHPERQYNVVLKLNGETFRGGGYGPVDYRTIPPVQRVLSEIMPKINAGRIRLDNLTAKAPGIELYILGNNRDIIPDVVYKDRNQILELEHRVGKTLRKPDLKFPVAIVTIAGSGDKRVYLTDTAEWLPFPFHPRILES